MPKHHSGNPNNPFHGIDIITGVRQAHISGHERNRVMETIRGGTRATAVRCAIIGLVPHKQRQMQIREFIMQTQAIDPYRRLIRSNERLQKLKMLHAPQILINNENRIFSDVVSALLQVGEIASGPVHFVRNDTVRGAFIER